MASAFYVFAKLVQFSHGETYFPTIERSLLFYDCKYLGKSLFIKVILLDNFFKNDVNKPCNVKQILHN